MSNPAIEVDHLLKRYGDVTAVRDVSFRVEHGEVVCLLGPNGAGKTTTTEIVEGYLQRDGGRVSVLGHDPARGERAFRERIGIVLQECGVQDDLTVTEVVSMYASYYPRRMATVPLLALVELDTKANDLVRNLSGGQRRRLDVGLALVGRPDVVFLDEPTTGFDPSARRQSWALIRRLTDLGTTVLLTTHFMDEAEALADRIVVVAGGAVVAEGTPATLGGRDRARSRVTATLPAVCTPGDLPDLPTDTVELRDGRLAFTTDHTTTATHRLTGWAIERGIDLADLTVTQPSLEDVYLSLTADLVDPRITKEPVR